MKRKMDLTELNTYLYYKTRKVSWTDRGYVCGPPKAACE